MVKVLWDAKYDEYKGVAKEKVILIYFLISKFSRTKSFLVEDNVRTKLICLGV